MERKKTKTPALSPDLTALPDKVELEDAACSAKDKSLSQLQEDIQKLHAAATHSVINALGHAIRAGVALLEVKSRLAHGFWSDWLAQNFSAETGLSSRTAQRYMSAAKTYLSGAPALDAGHSDHPALKNLPITRLLQCPGKLNPKAAQSSPIPTPVRGNEWLTPKPIVAAAVSLLGEIDLDPAAEPGASNVPAKTHITAAQNALRPAATWRGSVFLNPGCDGNLLPWVEKTVSAFNAGDVPEALLLLPAAGHPDWSALIRGFPAAFTRRHLEVAIPDDDQLRLVKRPLMFAYLSKKPDINLFAKHFSPLSDVYVPFSSKESRQ